MNQHHVYQIHLTFLPSVSAREACREALDFSIIHPRIVVTFDFNQVHVHASLGSLGPHWKDGCLDEMAQALIEADREDREIDLWPPTTSEGVRKLFLEESRSIAR